MTTAKQTIQANPTKKLIISAALLVLIGLMALALTHQGSENTDHHDFEMITVYLDQGDHNSAIILLKNVLQKEPDNLQARMLLGSTYLTIGNTVSAEKELSKAHQLDPNNPLIRIALAKALFQETKFNKIPALIADTINWSDKQIAETYTIQAQEKIYHGELDQAQALLFKANQLDKTQPDLHFTQAFLKIQRRQPEQAKTILQQLLSKHPKHARALLLRADIALASQEYKAAILDYTQAVKLQKNNWSAKIKLSKVLIEDNQLDQASKQLKSVLSVAPQHPLANYLQALINLKQKDFENAAKHAQVSLDQTQDHLPSLYIAGIANYRQNRNEIAYRQVNALLRQVPGHTESLKLKVALEIKLGLTDEVTTTLVQIDNDGFGEQDISLVIAAGLASLESGDYDLGKRLLQKATRLKSLDPRIHLGQAALALKQGDIESGIAELVKAVEQVPDSKNSKIALILSYLQNRQPDKALAMSIPLSQADAQSSVGAVLTGVAYIIKNDLTKAEKAFAQALAIEPGEPNASHNLAVIALQKNDVAKARRLHQGVIQHHPNDLKSLVELFLIDWQAGKYPQASNWLEHAVLSNPEALPARLMLSQLYLRQNKPTQSLAISKQALASNPNNTDLIALIGEAHRLMGQLAEAITSFNKLSQLIPSSFMPHYRLASIYQITGQLALANEALNKALAINPQHLGALYIKGRIALKSGNTKEASAIVQALQKLVPDNAFITELKAQIAIKNKLLPEAVELYRHVLTQRETNFVNTQLASSLWHQNKHQEAIENLVHWTNRYPEDVLTINVLANFYLLDNQLDNALSQFSTIVKLTPNNALAHNNLAWLQLKAGNVDSALKHAQQASKLAPKDPDAMDTLGMIFLEKGNYTAAERLFANAIELQPRDLNMQFHLAQASAKVGAEEKAEQLLLHILSPENNQARFAYREAAEQLLSKLK